MERITLYVPEKLNDGSPVLAEVLKGYEDDMGDISLRSLIVSGRGSRGCTVSENHIGVWWSESGSKYREPVRLYSIDVVEGDLAYELTRDLAARINLELGQEAGYLTRSPIEGSVVVTERVTA